MASNSEDILRELKQAGHKFTGKRKDIVDLFVAQEGKYLTAKDVYESMRRIHPNISLDTVYRTIALLERLHIIEPLEFTEEAVKYRIACESGHHHHLICLGCGRTAVLKDCPIPFLDTQVDNFVVLDHRFELYGYCSTCQSEGQMP